MLIYLSENDITLLTDKPCRLKEVNMNTYVNYTYIKTWRENAEENTTCGLLTSTIAYLFSYNKTNNHCLELINSYYKMEIINENDVFQLLVLLC